MCVPFYDVNFEHFMKVLPICHFSPNCAGSFPLHYRESVVLIWKSTTQQCVIVFRNKNNFCSFLYCHKM